MVSSSYKSLFLFYIYYHVSRQLNAIRFNMDLDNATVHFNIGVAISSTLHLHFFKRFHPFSHFRIRPNA
jgi:hypothetical protein